jgi:hypothetical protein
MTAPLTTDTRASVFRYFVNAPEVDARLNQVLVAGCP